jgi:hypothetical protein
MQEAKPQKATSPRTPYDEDKEEPHKSVVDNFTLPREGKEDIFLDLGVELSIQHVSIFKDQRINIPVAGRRSL